MTDINPITKTDYPDPDVIRVGDTYYMVSTTMYYSPGGAILKSYDLVNWEILTYLYDELDGSEAERLEGGKTNYGKGMWAPSLRYHNGKFYIAFVSHGREDTHLFVADDICGPWEHRHIGEYFHDCSLLFDDDGKVYIASGNMNIRVVELNDDLTNPRPGGVDKVIIRDNPDKVGLGYEGSHFYKINGKYVLTLIHWPKESGRRTEAVFVSDKVDGEYVGQDVMWDDMGLNNMGVAQGGIVDTPDGKTYAILFQDSGAVGRVPVLVPVEWVDNFPVFGTDGLVPKNPVVVSTRPDYKYEPLYTSKIWKDEKASTDSVNAELMPQWQWNHVPDNSLRKPVSGGGISLKTGRIDVNPVKAKNTLTQRMMLPGCSACVTIDATGLKDGDTAGLIALEGRYCMLGIHKRNGRYYLIRLARTKVEKPFAIGFPDDEPGEVLFEREINCSKVTVRLKADFDKMKDELITEYVSEDGSEIIGEPFKMSFGLDHFTGVRFGLCCFSQISYGGEAVFEQFRYEY